MIKIICPRCKHQVRKVIGVRILSHSLYYIDRERFGWLYLRPGRWRSILNKLLLKDLVAFECRFCGQAYPQNMKRRILKSIKLRSILNKLQSDQ